MPLCPSCIGVKALSGSKKAPAAPGSTSSATSGEEAQSEATTGKKGEDAKRAEKQKKGKKRLLWGLLACILLALLIGIAVAIAVPVSKQNRAKAMQSAAASGAKGQPLTFKVDVSVPPDDDPLAGPVCGTMFGGQGGNRKVQVSAALHPCC